jgi:hypothetical protein
MIISGPSAFLYICHADPILAVQTSKAEVLQANLPALETPSPGTKYDITTALS